METIAITPNQDDILCGSCYDTVNHMGNAKFGYIVAKHFNEYYTAVRKKGKMRVGKRILSEILASGAMFLKKDTSRDYWYIANIKVGKDKISHVLRIMKRAKEKRETATTSQKQPRRSPSPNHNYVDVWDLARQAHQQTTSLLQQQQEAAPATASIMSQIEPIMWPGPEQQDASRQQPTMC